MVENAGLTEWPVPLLGRFDADFLDVPREVIVLTMRTNQKYFACTGDDGALAPAFVCIANIDATDGGESIVEGNRRVLAARLSDARFFWEQDLKVPLEEQAQKLERIAVPREAWDRRRQGRACGEARALAGRRRHCQRRGTPTRSSAPRDWPRPTWSAAWSANFPSLQGVIGGYLAAAQGEPRPSPTPSAITTCRPGKATRCRPPR